MNTNTSPADRQAAPSWLSSWSRFFKWRDKVQYEQNVYRCERCAKQHAKNPDRGYWQYGLETDGDYRLVMACGHFVKAGEPLPPSTSGGGS